MKKQLSLLCLLPLLFVSQLLWSQTTHIEWSAPIVVGDGAVYENTRPRIVLNQAKEPIVLWGHHANYALYAAKWNGNGFTAPVRISPTGIDALSNGLEGPSMAAAGDTIFVAFQSLPYHAAQVYTVRSLDGGLTWGDTVRVTQLGNDIPLFSTVAVQPGGNPAVTFMRNEPNFINPFFAVARSEDGGATYLPDVNASPGISNDVCECCPPDLLLEGNRAVTLFRNNANNIRDIWGGLSTDSAQTFSTGFMLDNSNWNVNSCPASGPDGLLAGDSLYTVWMTQGGGRMRVKLSSYNLATQQAGQEFEIWNRVPNSARQNFPIIDGHSDTLGVCWQSVDNGGDAVFIWTINGISAFEDPVNINPDNAPGSQVNPHMEFHNGTFHFVYQDNETNEVMYRTGTIALGVSRETDEITPPALTLYPNPSNGNLWVEIAETGGILQVFSANGAVCCEQKVKANKTRLSLSHLPPGLYLTRYTDRNGRFGYQKTSLY